MLLSTLLKRAIKPSKILSYACISFLVILLSSTKLIGQAGKNYQHWADGDAATATAPSWNNNILSANKSDYFEGEVIPHVAIIPASNNTPLVQNTNYVFTVIYNYYQANTNAGGFAFMTTYNISRQPTAFGTVTPAPDPSGHTGTGSQGVFYVGPNVDIISAGAPVTTGTGTKDQTVTITFKWTGATTMSGSAYIFYGLYIAEPGKVPSQGSGATDGANAWTGGSLQTTLNSTFTGGLSLQLAPSAIIPGAISGVKFRDLDNDGVKDAGETLLPGWTIQLDNDTDPNNGIISSTVTDANGFYTFSVTPDAIKVTTGVNDPYIVREVNQAGWTQTKPVGPNYYSVIISAITPIAENKDFGNFTCVNPTITPSIANICEGTTSISLSYTSTNTPTQYVLNWDAPTLTDVTTYTNLPASPVSINVPGNLPPGTYTGTITVKTALGCASSATNISFTVNAGPVASAGNAPSAQCENADNGNTFNLDGNGSGGTASWAIAPNGNPNSLDVQISSGNTFDPSVQVSGGTGSVTLRLTVASNATPSCGSATSDVTVTVNPNPTAEAGTTPTAQCRLANGNTFSLNGSGTNGTPSWAVFNKPAGVTVTFNPNPPNTLNPQVTITGGTGVVSVTLRLTVTSANCGSATDDVTVTVNPNPTANAGIAPAAQCYDANGNTFNLNGSGTNGNPSWAVQSNPNNLTVVFNPIPPNTFTPSVTVSGGTGSVTLRLTVVSDNCGNATSDVTVTVNDLPSAPDAEMVAPSCTDKTFKVVVHSSDPAVTYLVTQTTGYSSSAAGNGDDLFFSGLTFGDGFNVVATNGSNCTSGATTCPLPAARTVTQSSNLKVETLKQTTVTAYPNPFNDRVRFRIESSAGGRASLDIYNVMGQKVKTPFQGNMQKGEVRTIDVFLPNAAQSNLMYIFRVGNDKVSGKLLKL